MFKNTILSFVRTLGFRQSVFASSPLHEDSGGPSLPTDPPTQYRHPGPRTLDTGLPGGRPRCRDAGPWWVPAAH
jgi:hypothetical protein